MSNVFKSITIINDLTNGREDSVLKSAKHCTHLYKYQLVTLQVKSLRAANCTTTSSCVRLSGWEVSALEVVAGSCCCLDERL